MPAQRGQAIVLIAIMLAVLIGMAALAIDGGRAYSVRRDLQAAVDAGVLAAGDKLQQTGSYTSAEQAASTIFGTNMRIYAAPSCSPGFSAPGAAPLTVTCTYSDGTVLTETVSALGPAGSQFALAARRNLQLQFARILTNGAVPKVGAGATANVNNLLYAPTVAALSQAGCGGVPGSAISINGGGTLGVIGDLVSNGTISISGGVNLQVGGDIFDQCQSPVPGAVSNTCYPSGANPPCTFPDVAGTTYSGRPVSDPAYPPPAVVGLGQGTPGTEVVLSPGTYAADPNFSSSVCYFLSAGVYKWQSGYTNSGGFVSNDLKPPDEPSTSNNQVLANQMWNTGGVNCAGAFQVSTPTSTNAVKAGTWAIEVTSARSDTYSGTSYKRESAPSMCRTVQVNGGQAIQVQISNVPGATSYNVYFEPPPNPGCAGPFGYGGSISLGATNVKNDSTTACPAFSGSTCSLGNETAVFDSTLLSAVFAPNPFVLLPVLGAYPPASETPPLRINLPNQNPDRAAPPAGDRANENQCDTIVGAATTCPGAITPGAVEFLIPNGGCLNATTSADNFLFSGYQYNWIMVYEPGASYPPANACINNVLGAEVDSAWVGLIYMPSAGLTVNKAATFRTEATGGLMAKTITFSGQMPTIIGSADFQPARPASRLTS
ncbi:MAG: pilus assembly protein TadG-related protein [Candidatus Dormiibacterota bacterium]